MQPQLLENAVALLFRMELMVESSLISWLMSAHSAAFKSQTNNKMASETFQKKMKNEDARLHQLFLPPKLGKMHSDFAELHKNIKFN